MSPFLKDMYRFTCVRVHVSMSVCVCYPLFFSLGNKKKEVNSCCLSKFVSCLSHVKTSWHNWETLWMWPYWSIRWNHSSDTNESFHKVMFIMKAQAIVRKAKDPQIFSLEGALTEDLSDFPSSYLSLNRKTWCHFTWQMNIHKGYFKELFL